MCLDLTVSINLTFYPSVQLAIDLLEEAKSMDILQLTHFTKLEKAVQEAKNLISVTRANEQ